MSSISAALGGAHSFDIDGKQYIIRLLTQERKVTFQRLLESRARRAVMEMKGEVTDVEWKEAWNSCVQDIAGGAYSFHGTASMSAIQTWGGLLSLGSVLCFDENAKRNVTEAEFEAIMLERGEEVNAIVALVLEESMGKNRKRPAVVAPSAVLETTSSDIM